MELDDLKTKWVELGDRLDRTEAKVQRLTAEIATGKFTSSKQRLMRIFVLKLAMLLMLPSYFLWLFRTIGEEPGMAVYVTMGAFFIAMAVRQVVLLAMLSRLDPGVMTVRDSCAAVLRLRKTFFVGIVVGITLMAALMLVLGLWFARLGIPEIMYGFIVGLIGGLAIGVRVFMKILREINALGAALRETDEI